MAPNFAKNSEMMWSEKEGQSRNIRKKLKLFSVELPTMTRNRRMIVALFSEKKSMNYGSIAV